MTRSYVEIWDWFNGFGEQAANLKDAERMRLHQLYSKGNSESQKYPEHALAMYREGQALATRLKESWIGMFYDCWIVSTLLFKLHRYEEGLDLAMKLVTKASQEEYFNCPVRARSFMTLIAAYYEVDGLSYIDEMNAMLDTMETQIALDKDSHLRLFGYRSQLWQLLGEHEKALQTAQLYVEMSADSAFRLTDGYETMCHLSYLQGNFQKALEYSHLSQEHALKSNRYDSLMGCRWWQAVLLFLRGETEEAARLYWLGIGEANTLERPKDISLWEGACRYYEVSGAYDRALLFWDEQVQLMNPKTPHRQSYFMIFLRRCFVLRKLGCLTEVDIEQTRQAALRMRKPEKYLAQMEKLHDGSLEIPRY